jgi:hypothetical protein
MCLNDHTADRQTDAQSPYICADKRLKQFCPHLGRQPRAGIRASYLYHAVRRSICFKPQNAIRATPRRLYVIADKVENDLLDLCYDHTTRTKQQHYTRSERPVARRCSLP